MKKILIAGVPALTQNYERAVASLGAQPTTALNVPDLSQYDGLILPGGGDIDPKLYGQLNYACRTVEPELDRIQLAILKSFVSEKKPVLGICKGMQLIHVYFGGSIIQHLPTYYTHQYDNGDRIHETHACHGSLMHLLYGDTFWVNSAHHQGVEAKGKCICYTQTAPDGVVEGLCHAFLPIQGIQWHPERLCPSSTTPKTVDGLLLFSAFLNQFLLPS